jgi:WD40 repeat protein
LYAFDNQKTKIWDMRMNDAPLQTLTNNVKTVNTVFVSEADNRLITGSVDCHVKVYDLNEVQLY